MKLHYSQTNKRRYPRVKLVSVPYEITLLSNPQISKDSKQPVSVPYEITLLSNVHHSYNADDTVSVPYEITLLSNLK